ncbi:MAG: helix-turn-helix domain-containing protein [Lachnospiraceae bacterium]
MKKIRMEKAAKLMEEKDFSITEIASMTGYNDVSLFIRNFKQATGMTPKRYRDELRKKKE